MVHDDRCALAHLLARDDVDAERVGVTGTSGGGLRTLHLAVLDDRPAAFAPTCAVTTRREWRRTGKRIDAEQVIHGAVPDGVGYEDLLAAAAPTPTFVGAAASDQYFPVEGAREAVARARRAFAAHDAGDALTLRVVDDGHTSVAGFGPDVYEFLCAQLDAGPYDPVPAPEPLDADRLRCTSSGNVLAAFDDERTVEQLLRAYVAERYPDAAGLDGDGERLGADPDDVDPASVREAVVETLDLDREGAPLHPRFGGGDDRADLSVERVWFRTERDPDAVVAGVLVVADEAPTAPAVVCYEDGTAALPERSAELTELAREHGAALAFDPRGVGAVRNRPIPIPPWVDDYHGIYGTEFKLAYDALLQGTSLLGLRTSDVVRAVEFLRAETGAAAASLVGQGTGAVHALYAAAATDDVAAVTARDPGASFAARATDDQRRFDPALTAFGLVGDADLPRVVAALEKQGVALSVER